MKPAIGISLITHLIIIAIVKTKQFLGIGMITSSAKTQKTTFQKITTAIVIAAIIEVISLFVIGSSAAVIYIGLANDKANFKLLNHFSYQVSTMMKHNITINQFITATH